jgi:hypothetical protein
MDKLKEKELRRKVREAEIKQKMNSRKADIIVKRIKKRNEIIDHAIAHLNGYALIVKARTGFIPVAVNDCIKDLRGLKNENK